MPKARIVLRILAFTILAFLAWVAFQPSPGRPNVSIKLLGYTNTNDTSGIRLAMIAVTNLSPSKIVIYLPRILIPSRADPRGFAYYDSHDRTQWHSELGASESGSFTIPPPTNQSMWKLSFYVYNDFGVAQVLKRLPVGRRMPYEIESEWIGSEK